MKRRFAIYPFTVFAVLTLFLSQAYAALPEIAGLAEKAGPSVVNIKAETTAKPDAGQGRRMAPMPRGRQGLEDFFKQFEERFGGQSPAPRHGAAVGSGFVISPDGFILTNNHVVEDADKLTVTFKHGGKGYDAKVIGRDPETDLALIKITPDKPLQALSLGDSDDAKVGQWVVAIGNPFGLENTVTSGIISAKGRVIGAGPYDDFLQTDASINPGNSGGPLLNLDGEVIGINTAIIASGQGIGFAIPSGIAKNVVAELKDNGAVKRGLLGVNIQDIDENTAKALGLDEAKGALVAQVNGDGPAEKAGVKTGDVISEVNGKAVKDSRDLTRTIGAMAPGDKVEITLLRKGDEKTVSATLASRDPKMVAEAASGSGQSDEALGMAVRPLEKQEAKALGLKKDDGLLITDVADGSVAAEGDLRQGDVILEVNQQPVETPDELSQAVQTAAKKSGVAMFLIVRDGHNLFRTVPVKA